MNDCAMNRHIIDVLYKQCLPTRFHKFFHVFCSIMMSDKFERSCYWTLLNFAIKQDNLNGRE